MGGDRSRREARDALPLSTDLSEEKERRPHRAGILHGRRQGRPLRDAPADAMARLLPACRMPPEGPIDLANLFGHPVSAVRLEIGFGGGEHLHAQAGRHPDIGFIGCEPFLNGVAALMKHMARESRDNIRVHSGDAGEIIDRLPDGCLSRVDLLYPDPWPKRRQRKRRFVSDRNLARLARVLRPGGRFRFATDIDHYAGWTLAHVARSADFDWPAQRAGDWLDPWPDWLRTRYEAKAIREGRQPAYLEFVRR